MLNIDVILRFLEDDLGIDTEDVGPDTLLFSTGIVDSFALVTLMLFLETEARFKINPSDVNLDNFDSIERMLAYVQRSAA